MSNLETATVEKRSHRPPTVRQLRSDFGWAYLGSGATGVLFSATGPVAVIMGASAAGGLSAQQTASWIMGVFVLNGALTLVTSWVYRMPLAFFWTIPWTVLVGQSLPHQQWSDVVGAYVVTGVLITVLGVTGLVPRLMKALPNAVVMAMVAGAFLSFGTSMVQAVSTDVAVAGSIVVTWLLVTANPRLASRVPAVLAALVVGIAVLALTNRFESLSGSAADLPWLGVPELVAPTWNFSACAELVIPLAVTVIVVQNGQGSAILRAAGHRPPMTATTLLCGLWSMIAAPMGAISTCLAGPTNALLVAEGRRERQYIAGMVCGGLAIVVGALAPTLVRSLAVVPATFVAALAGVAMLESLRSAFVAAFSAPSGSAPSATLGPLVTLLVTISGIQIAGLAAPFWGLVAGVATGWFLARGRKVPS